MPEYLSLDVAEEGVRPMLIIEIVEPETRENDVERKVEHYTRAGVAQYVIVDNVGWQGQRQLQLLNYRLFSGRYQLQPTNNRGRVYLEVARLWPGIEGDHVFLLRRACGSTW
jgi:Uma2 family endonuclease